MNILYTIGWPLGQGGHINSTLSLISDLIELKKVNKVFLIAPNGEKKELFEKLGVKYIKIKNCNNNLLFSFLLVFTILKASFINKISLIHCMDYKSLLGTIIANLFLLKPIVFTKAGGKAYKFPLPKISSVIVFSKELLNDFKTRDLYYKQEKIFLIKERIKLEDFTKKVHTANNEDVSIFIAMRLYNEKKKLLENFFLELEKSDFSNNVTINIAGDGILKDYCKENAKLIESKSNSNFKFNFLGEINNKLVLNKYYIESTIVVGHGRGIMEAMALGKPVVLLAFDKIGSALINKDNIFQAADYNFSGRNLTINETTLSLSEVLKFIFNKKLDTNSLGKFNSQFIKNEYDSKIGARKTQCIYNEVKKIGLIDNFFNLLWVVRKKNI